MFKVCSQELAQGEIIAIMQVLDFLPMNELRKTWVNWEPRNGRYLALVAIARMHSLSASSDLLISAPSARTRRSLAVSDPRSFPARSTREKDFDKPKDREEK